MLFLSEIFYGSLQLSLHCSFLLDLLLHDLCSLHDCSSPDHLPKQQPKVLIFLAKACQLIFNNSFNFIREVLLVVFYVLGLLMCVLVWNSSVSNDHFFLS
jgi:hypothetical protein